MKMKKMMFLMLTLLIGSTVSMNAQVTIGSNQEPHVDAVLDLQSTTQGLLLPRVALVSTTSFIPLKAHVAGMTVYNIAVNGSGATAVTPGIYTNDGSKWIRLAEGASVAVAGAPVITTQPTAFTFSRLKDVNGDPNSDVTSFNTTLTVEATGDTPLKYQWYQKPKNTNGAGTAISSATSASYAVNIPADGLSNWGMYSYYCEVSNAKGSIKSEEAEVALGCGAKTVDGEWLSFMCYNLGADTSLDPFDTDFDTGEYITNEPIRGGLFQWGRRADGHESRSAEIATGPYDGPLIDGQIPQAQSDSYGKFLTVAATTYSWRPMTNKENYGPGPLINDLCADGWVVPSTNLFHSLLIGSNPALASDYRTNTVKYENGILFSQNGIETLFLPSTGFRNRQTGVFGQGYRLRYWGSDADTENPEVGKIVLATTSNITFTTSGFANGEAVRCVAE